LAIVQSEAFQATPDGPKADATETVQKKSATAATLTPKKK
jgi:hypothetical protein